MSGYQGPQNLDGEYGSSIFSDEEALMSVRTISRRSFFQKAVSTTFLAASPDYQSLHQEVKAADDSLSRKDLTQSQLFLDDTWIAESLRLERVWEDAEVFPEPVLIPDRPWEGWQVVMFGSVFRLQDQWRMYYMTYNLPKPSNFCLAFSDDGLHWKKPELGLVNYEGSKANNILWTPPEGENHDGQTVCYDAPDSKFPFKLMYYSFGGKRPAGEYVAFSRDGINWQHQSQPVLSNTGDRTNVMSTRDHRGKYVAYLRHKDMMKLYRARTVWRSESEDFVQWTDPQLILKPDLLDDPNTELYGMAAFPYSDLYLGMLERWYGNPDVIEIQLAWSHDGLLWDRPQCRKAFIGNTLPWSKSWISCANTAPVLEHNQLWFYFGGRSGAHHQEYAQSYGAIGLASISVDRFAAIRGDFKEGELLTKPMVWPGGDLVLNCTNTRYPKGHPAAGGGTIAIEIRDVNNHPVKEFSGEQKAFHNVVSPPFLNATLPPVRWPSNRSIKELAGQQIRLVFQLRDARLYSFRATRLQGE